MILMYLQKVISLKVLKVTDEKQDPDPDQWYGSADLNPDMYKNFMDPQHCL
jgi:hypothetical protein